MDIIAKMLERVASANVNAAPLFGKHAGRSVLWNAVSFDLRVDCHFPKKLIQAMLKKCPYADLQVTPPVTKYANWEMLLFAIKKEDWKNVLEIVRHPNKSLDAFLYADGMIALICLAYKEKWDIVREILDTYPTANPEVLVKDLIAESGRKPSSISPEEIENMPTLLSLAKDDNQLDIVAKIEHKK